MTIENVFKVATKGRNEDLSSLFQWVTKYQLKYSLSNNEADFEYVTSASGDVMTFDGNTDRNSVVENEFATVSVLFFRLCVIEWHNHIALRWEVYSC